MDEIAKAHLTKQVIGIGNLLEEIGEKHEEYYSSTAEAFAIVCVLAEQVGLVEDADRMIDLMRDNPDEKLDILRDAMEMILTRFRG